MITGRHSGWIRVGTSLAFALTPFWPSGMLSTLGMPLALWAFFEYPQQGSFLEELFGPYTFTTLFKHRAWLFSSSLLQWAFFG
ncbi:DUF6044 family protein [Peribacillus frigoritolerans]|nr:DUF6044 family protein [Peribacillus frigoritolerans]